ncbi:MAG: carbonic anhydrase [Chitinophagaceae bacterium]|nr:carbonic anhydrase [Chitinophagaceae bacterium]
MISCTGQRVEQNPHQVVLHSADEALAELKKGNKRFIENKMWNTNYAAEIENTKGHQNPHSIILGCIDSRVPPEIVFDQGIGNIFVSRVAGNVEDDDVLGSIEFAIKVKHTKLIVVLGHSHCGAVQGAIDNVEMEHLTQLTDQINPAIHDQESYPMENVKIDITSRKNVEITLKHILALSKTVNDLVTNGEVKIIGAYYNVENGEVSFFDK